MQKTTDSILPFLEKYYTKDEPIILACSAGPDSMFLLYKILETEYKKNLVVCYFNHKTRPETDIEEEFLENLAKKEGFAFETASCDFDKIQKLYPSKSFEELAREKRYQFFDAILQIYKTNKVLLAHHLDDKIETFFFNLARGTKLTGLINMTEISNPSPSGQGELSGKDKRGYPGVEARGGTGILRPLLKLEKFEILEYLDNKNLKYFIDSSNLDNKYTRNNLRNNIIPKFEEVNSSYKKNISNTINYFEEVKEFIDGEIKIFLEEQGILIFNSCKYKINTLEIYGYFYIIDFNKKSDFFKKELIRHIFYISNNKSTIGLSEANIAEIIKFINGKNNKTIKEKFFKNLKMRKENKFKSFVIEFFNILKKIIKVFILIYLFLLFLISIDGLIFFNKEIKAKYAIVYGSKVKDNGEVSNRLKARLDKSIELLSHKKVEKIIVSGGLGESGFNEAIIMRKYLIKKGIKIPRIIIDKSGNTTKDTSKNSYYIIKKKGDDPNIGVIGVSQFFHCSRVKLSLKKSGFSNIYCESPEYYEYRDIYSLIREVPAYIKYFFMGFDEIDINKEDLKKLGEKIGKKIKEKYDNF